MSAMERMRQHQVLLRWNHPEIAADLAKLIAVAEAAQQYDLHGDYDDLIAALDNLTSNDEAKP
jgi:uncharacterized protein YacL (UPF0231 family)